MAITFDLSGKGPTFEHAGLSLHFKRTFKDLRADWTSIHSPLSTAHFANGVLAWDLLEPSHKSWLAQCDHLFARDHITAIDGAVDDAGQPITWADLSPESQLELLRQLSHHTSYTSTTDAGKTITKNHLDDFIQAYGLGSEKKSVDLATRQP